jgi:hypothetical protein
VAVDESTSAIEQVLAPSGRIVPEVGDFADEPNYAGDVV